MPLTAGTRVKLRSPRPGSPYTTGTVYEVTTVDHGDNTVKLKFPDSGSIGPWIKEEYLEALVGVGWTWLQQQLPSEIITLLTCFKGLSTLELETEVKDALLLELPDLQDRLMAAATAVTAVPPPKG